MSEPTLYREATNREIQYKPNRPKGARKMWVVPVERCKHGKIDEHFVRKPYSRLLGKWCPGAGIGGDEAMTETREGDEQ